MAAADLVFREVKYILRHKCFQTAQVSSQVFGKIRILKLKELNFYVTITLKRITARPENGKKMINKKIPLIGPSLTKNANHASWPTSDETEGIVFFITCPAVAILAEISTWTLSMRWALSTFKIVHYLLLAAAKQAKFYQKV